MSGGFAAIAFVSTRQNYVMSDATADSDARADEVTGKLSEALEYIERARGHLYSFHQLTGHADLLLDDVIEAADGAGTLTCRS